jgi:ubiquinone/menaquinone biosynthesis C-methylase UbiE
VNDFFRVAAPFYDADYAALRWDADVPFYVDLARESGGPVLEMGCGTGRVLLPVARAGVRIHGIDFSSDMLAQLESKLAVESAEVRDRVSFSQGDIRSADVGAKFSLVTAPFGVAQLLLARGDQRAWLRNVSRHLLPGGALCFDVFQPNYSYLVEPRGPYTDVDRTDPATGRRTRRVARTVPHNEFQTIDVEFHWIVEERDRTAEAAGALRLRWFTRGELENLLELEGFEITDYWGSFSREPFGEGAAEQIVRAVFPGAP